MSKPDLSHDFRVKVPYDPRLTIRELPIPIGGAVLIQFPTTTAFVRKVGKDAYKITTQPDPKLNTALEPGSTGLAADVVMVAALGLDKDIKPAHAPEMMRQEICAAQLDLCLHGIARMLINKPRFCDSFREKEPVTSRSGANDVSKRSR